MLPAERAAGNEEEKIQGRECYEKKCNGGGVLCNFSF
jgi:hypothetical protein